MVRKSRNWASPISIQRQVQDSVNPSTTFWRRLEPLQVLPANEYRCGLDRIESELSNALRFKSISYFLANISSFEVMTILWKIQNMHWKNLFFCIWYDFKRNHIRKEMRYGLQSKCIVKFRLYAVKLTSTYAYTYQSRGSNFRQFVVEGLTLWVIFVDS